MHNLAMSYINLSEEGMQLLNYGLVILGFIASLMTWRQEWRLRRTIYFLSLAAITAGTLLSQFSWFGISNWMGNGPSIVFTLTVIVYLAAGYGYGILSIARSHDISGDRGSAWMGIVPLANLYLIFKRGQDLPGVERRPALSRFVLDPLLVIVGIILIGGTNGLVEAMARSAATRDAALLSSPSGLAELAQQVAAQVQTQMPIRIDEITQATSVQAVGSTLVYTYEVDAGIDSFREDFPPQLRRNLCSPQGFAEIISTGIAMRIIYRRASDGYQILEMPLDKDICAAA